MPARPVLRMGNPGLRSQAAEMTESEITSQQTKQLVQDMLDTMHAEQGIGLAAPQIGVSKQLAIIGVPQDSERYPDSEETPLLVVINPEITVLDEAPQGFWEGCLSVPGLRGFVERPSKIRVDYLDLQGKSQSLELEGFLATVFQHEIDHLEGVLYIDRIKDTTKLSFVEEFVQFWTDQDEPPPKE